jgi:hypothetical protein
MNHKVRGSSRILISQSPQWMNPNSSGTFCHGTDPESNVKGKPSQRMAAKPIAPLSLFDAWSARSWPITKASRTLLDFRSNLHAARLSA